MSKIVLRNGEIINEGKIFYGDILIENDKIASVGSSLKVEGKYEEVNAEGKIVMPGVIDDQVHFREPGLTHKATIATESAAAVAGGVTSWMEMPNTVPPSTTQALLANKYETAAETAWGNYSFFMGTANNNLDEILRTDGTKVCGIKIFMGSSTGGMLVDNPQTLDKIFSQCNLLIATHCEDETTIKHNLSQYVNSFGTPDNAALHPVIRDVKACYTSSSFAVELAKKHGTRLHVLHISTAKELELFKNDLPLEKKKITAEACVHHLWFSDEDYADFGNLIKCNPAIKRPSDRQAIRTALIDNVVDVIATDHAPHTWDEKAKPYSEAPAGLPLVQHSIQMMFDLYERGVFSKEMIVEKMAHSPAKLFRINNRGFLREGYKADIVILEKKPFTVSKDNIFYKGGWSMLEGHTFAYTINRTIVNGTTVFEGGRHKQRRGERLTFTPY